MPGHARGRHPASLANLRKGRQPGTKRRGDALAKVHEAAKRAAPEAVAVLVAALAATDGDGLADWRTRIRAASLLLDRAMGRPFAADAPTGSTAGADTAVRKFFDQSAAEA